MIKKMKREENKTKQQIQERSGRDEERLCGDF
jgi:hypothetical protein